MQRAFKGKIENYKTGKVRNVESGDTDQFIEIKFRVFNKTPEDVAAIEGIFASPANEYKQLFFTIQIMSPAVLENSSGTEEQDE